MSDRIVITHASVVHALGQEPTEVFNRLIAGEHGISAWPLADEFHQARGAQIRYDVKQALGSGNWRGHTRASLMACLAGRKLWQTLVSDQAQEMDGDTTGITLGFITDTFSKKVQNILYTQEYKLINPFFFLNFSPNAAASQVSILLKLRAFTLTISTGFTAGLEALDLASQALRAGRAQMVLAGAVQAGSEEAVRGFATAARLPGPEHGVLRGWRPGAITLGEGCALFSLLKEAEARRSGLRPRAWIRGFGMGYNSQAAGLGYSQACRDAVLAALEQAGCGPQDVDVVFLAANGDPGQDQAEVLAMQEIFGNRLPAMTALKGALGETWYAGGALAVALAILCMENSLLPPTQFVSAGVLAKALDLPIETRPLNAQRALIMALDSDHKAAALLVERLT